MADHAGFAAAVTVSEHVLNTALVAAYANGSFPTTLEESLPGAPAVAARLFLGQPGIDCDGAANRLVLTLPMWGRMTVDGALNPVQIAGEIEVTLPPAFWPGAASLPFLPEPSDILVRRWTVAVTSSDTPPDVAAYLAGDGFRERLQTFIQLAVSFRKIKLPSLDVSFLGPLPGFATSVDGRVRDGALLLGLNLEDQVGTDTYSLVGDVAALSDFARANDMAGVVNPAAVKVMLNTLSTRLTDGVVAEGASLDRLEVTPAAGYFQVRGAASKSSATINFAFRVVPSMFHTRAGAVFNYLPKPRRVNSRTWAALDFRIEGVETDVDRSWWVIVLDILGLIPLGLGTLYIEGMVSAAAANFSGQVKAAKPGAPAARVRRTIPPPGGVSVRVGLDQFEVSSDGVYVGISVRPTPTSAALLGPVVVPSTYAGDPLRYVIRTPSGVWESDPALRVRWRLEDRTHGVVLNEQDSGAMGRLRFDFVPPAGIADFGVTARLYRQLGASETDLATLSVNVHMRGALPAGAYVRWRWEATTPQVAVNEATEMWSYQGELRRRRWSEWHRTDAPCRAVEAPSRYRFEVETADRLPFSLKLLESHRGGLCPYCFYGGPAGLNAAL